MKIRPQRLFKIIFYTLVYTLRLSGKTENREFKICYTQLVLFRHSFHWRHNRRGLVHLYFTTAILYHSPTNFKLFCLSYEEFQRMPGISLLECIVQKIQNEGVQIHLRFFSVFHISNEKLIKIRIVMYSFK